MREFWKSGEKPFGNEGGVLGLRELIEAHMLASCPFPCPFWAVAAGREEKPRLEPLLQAKWEGPTWLTWIL